MKNDFLESDEFKELLNKYEQSLAQGSSCYLEAEDFCDIADYYINNAKPEQSLACADAGLRLHPDDEVLKSVKASTLIYLHRYEEARSLIKDCDQEMDEIVYQNAQLVYALDGDADKAEEMMCEWIARQRKELEWETDKQKREEGLRDCYIHAICTFIELTENHQYDAELVSRWVEDYIATFSPLGEYDSDLILADTVREEGLMEMVAKVYSNILETQPYITYGWAVLANAQFCIGEYEEALESVEFALDIHPDDWDSMLTKAHALYTMGRKVEAIPYFEKFIENTNDNSQFLAYAICLIVKGDFPAAYENLQLAEPYYEAYTDDKEFYAESSFELGDSYLACDKYEDAERCLNRAMEILPDRAHYYLSRGTLYIIQNKVKEGIEDYIIYINNCGDVGQGGLNIVIRLVTYGHDLLALELIDAIEKNTGLTDEDKRRIMPYKAISFAQMEKMAECLECLKECCEKCPDLLEPVFGHLFPPTVLPQDYYEYYIKAPIKPF